MRVVLFTLMSVVCTVAVSATVYRWVDENGVTHYSDQPHENAEKVHVAAPQTYKPTPLPASPPSQNAQPQASNTYQCQVVAPANDDSFSNTYSVDTAVQVNPSPHNGDQVFLLMDGARVPNFPAVGGAFTITNIDRGQHTLQAVVQDTNGKLLCQSANVTFTVLQPSVLNPANPNFKR
jgi:Domain of unknown function (DUF4124)